MSTFDEYQRNSRKTAVYPEIKQRFVYPAMGLAGEAGELLNKMKKIFRDEGGVVSPSKRKEIADELGDILWYTAQIATEFDLSLKEIADKNLEKLNSRKERGVLKGSGDER